jgi:hypothetical protein
VVQAGMRIRRSSLRMRAQSDGEEGRAEARSKFSMICRERAPRLPRVSRGSRAANAEN